jgi:SAM-dependent methyltransferase
MTENRQGTRLHPLLEAGDDADSVFDSVYPDWVRYLSSCHWTPFEVAMRASGLLVTSARTRVLDVGSGSGKFCIIGALATPGRFYGVEQRANLVEVATQAARDYAIEERVCFIHANMTTVDWSEFDAFYLYNPFYEHAGQPFDAIDNSIEFDSRLRDAYVAFTKKQLKLARVGTRVVTYHGFGGNMPPSYRCVRREGCGTDFVELWVKQPTALWIPPSDRTRETSARSQGMPAAREERSC